MGQHREDDGNSVAFQDTPSSRWGTDFTSQSWESPPFATRVGDVPHGSMDVAHHSAGASGYFAGQRVSRWPSASHSTRPARRPSFPRLRQIDDLDSSRTASVPRPVQDAGLRTCHAYSTRHSGMPPIHSPLWGTNSSAWREPGCCLRLRLHDETLAHGIEHDLRRVVQVQLLHQVGPVRLDRRQPEIEQRRHLLVRSSFGEQLEDLLLAIGQQVIGIGQAALSAAAHVVLDEHGGDRRTEERLAGGDGADRREQILVGRVLQQVGARAGRQRANDVRLVGVHAEDDHAGGRSSFCARAATSMPLSFGMPMSRMSRSG